MIKGVTPRRTGEYKYPRRTVIHLLSVMSLVLGIIFLSSCRQYSEAQQQRFVLLDIRASQDVNPNRFFEPAPLAITVYSLASPGLSDEMSIDELIEQTQGQGNKKINSLYQAIIQPGEVLAVKLNISTDITTLGVAGEYRDIENARWKSEIQLADLRQGSWVKRTFTSSGKQLTAQFNRLEVTLTERE